MEDDCDDVRRAIRSGVATFSQLLILVDTEPPQAPPEVMAALAGLLACRRDLNNGGFDQFVWNHGAERARAIAAAWREVGAVENAELLCWLADELPVQPPVDPDDVTGAFFRYRRAVNGPTFDVPPVADELEEALLERVLERPERFEDGS